MPRSRQIFHPGTMLTALRVSQTRRRIEMASSCSSSSRRVSIWYTDWSSSGNRTSCNARARRTDRRYSNDSRSRFPLTEASPADAAISMTNARRSPQLHRGHGRWHPVPLLRPSARALWRSRRRRSISVSGCLAARKLPGSSFLIGVTQECWLAPTDRPPTYRQPLTRAWHAPKLHPARQQPGIR